MAVSSMTGFARAAGSSAPWRWAFELKSVNAKGLDLRLRMPAPFDRVETEARARLAKALARGTCFGTLAVSARGSSDRSANRRGRARNRSPPRRAKRLRKPGLRRRPWTGSSPCAGWSRPLETADDEASIAAACAGALASVDEAIVALAAARRGEGEALAALLSDRLKAIAALVEAADANPARRPEAVRDRLAESVEALMGSSRGLDENRLYQEAILLAAKADIREELDRLKTHVGAALALIEEGGPIGRRLDFLAQELAREASTLCAKANDVSLTAQGLELRAQIEQFREQVQNVE